MNILYGNVNLVNTSLLKFIEHNIYRVLTSSKLVYQENKKQLLINLIQKNPSLIIDKKQQIEYYIKSTIGDDNFKIDILNDHHECKKIIDQLDNDNLIILFQKITGFKIVNILKELALCNFMTQLYEVILKYETTSQTINDHPDIIKTEILSLIQNMGDTSQNFEKLLIKKVCSNSMNKKPDEPLFDHSTEQLAQHITEIANQNDVNINHEATLQQVCSILKKYSKEPAFTKNIYDRILTDLLQICSINRQAIPYIKQEPQANGLSEIIKQENSETVVTGESHVVESLL